MLYLAFLYTNRIPIYINDSHFYMHFWELDTLLYLGVSMSKSTTYAVKKEWETWHFRMNQVYCLIKITFEIFLCRIIKKRDVLWIIRGCKDWYTSEDYIYFCCNIAKCTLKNIFPPIDNFTMQCYIDFELFIVAVYRVSIQNTHIDLYIISHQNKLII